MKRISTILLCTFLTISRAGSQPDTLQPQDFQRELDKALDQEVFGDELDPLSAKVLARTERFMEAVIGAGAAANPTFRHPAFRSGSQTQRFCRTAAFDRASYVFNDIKFGEIAKGFARIAIDIEKDLVSLGGSSIVKFAVDKTKSQIEQALKDAIKEYFAGLPTVSFRHSPGILGFGVPKCKPELFLRWDIRSSRYEVWIKGDCTNEEVRIKTGNTTKIDYLGAWIIHISGESNLTYDEQNEAVGAYIPNGGPPPSLQMSVNCHPKEGTYRMVDINAKANASMGGIGADTGLILNEGDRLKISVDTGMQWSAGNSEPCTRVSNADGIEECYGIHRQGGLSTRHGTLVGRVGEGDFFAVGTRYTDQVRQSGPLRLYYWDSHAEDNEGTIQAKVEVFPGGH